MNRPTSTIRFWLPFALGGLAVGAASLFMQGVLAPRAAYAQVPDSGAQRAEMVQELKASNQKLAEITGLLREIRDLQAAAAGKDKAAKPASPKP